MFHHQLCGFSDAAIRRHQKRKHHRIAKLRTSILGAHKKVWWFQEIWLTTETYHTWLFWKKTSHSSDESLQLLVLVPEFLRLRVLSYDCSQTISDILFHYRWMAIQHASCIHRDTVDRWQASKLVSPWHQTDLVLAMFLFVVHLAKRTWNQYGGSSLPSIDKICLGGRPNENSEILSCKMC